MAIANFAFWTGVFAFCLVFLSFLINVFGHKNLVTFYGNGFEIRFSQIGKTNFFNSSDLINVTEQNKILTFSFNNLDKQPRLSLLSIDPSERNNLTEEFKNIINKNKELTF